MSVTLNFIDIFMHFYQIFLSFTYTSIDFIFIKLYFYQKAILHFVIFVLIILIKSSIEFTAAIFSIYTVDSQLLHLKISVFICKVTYFSIIILLFIILISNSLQKYYYSLIQSAIASFPSVKYYYQTLALTLFFTFITVNQYIILIFFNLLVLTIVIF